MVLLARGSLEEIIDSEVEEIRTHPQAFLGPWLLTLVSLTLMMGILITQTTKYFSTFGYESLQLFLLVVSGVLLAIAEWIVLVFMEWDWSIKSYGDWRRFDQVSRGSVTLPIIAWVGVFTSQLFFASRCYTLYGRSKLVFGSLLFGMVASLGLFVACSIMRVKSPDSYIMAILSPFGLVMNVATDVAITGLTLWKIVRGCTTYGLKTQHGLRRLRNMTIEAAVLPTISVILNITACITMDEKNTVSHLWASMNPMLYLLSMIFTLNFRATVSQTFNAPNCNDDERVSTGFQFANVQASGQIHGQGGHVEKTTVVLATIRESAYTL